jgi:hypothetical protein
MYKSTTIIASTALLFATSIHAGSTYDDFTEGNPEFSGGRIGYHGVAAVQPSVGSDVSRYQGIADGNPDLFSVNLDAGEFTGNDSQPRPDIYGAFGASPDLSY